MKKMFALILSAALTLSLAACSSSSSTTSSAESTESTTSSPEMILKMATDSGLDYPTTMALSFFGERLFELTDGRIQVDIYESAILGDEVSYLEQLQMGTVDLAKVSVGTLGGLYTDLQVFNLPFLFANSDEMWQVLESEVGEQIKTDLNEYNIQGIGYTDNGSRNFVTTFPIEGLESFVGKNIRVQQNTMMIGLIENLGGNPVNVAATEVYSALSTGVADGAENNVTYMLSESYHEVAPYVTLDMHTIGMDIICMNLDLYNSLSADDQAAVDQAMEEATAYDREIWDAAADESTQGLIDDGAIVTELDPAVQATFRAAMQPLYDQFDAEFADWLAAFDEVLG